MWRNLFFIFISSQYFSFVISSSESTILINCDTLRMGQFLCPDPDYFNDLIDPKTQEIRGCTKEHLAKSIFFNISMFIHVITYFYF